MCSLSDQVADQKSDEDTDEVSDTEPNESSDRQAQPYTHVPHQFRYT